MNDKKNAELSEEFTEYKEILSERMELAQERIREIAGEQFPAEGFDEYFRSLAQYLLVIGDNRKFVQEGGLKTASLEELQKRNREMYADILPEHYGESFGNPVYAAERLGQELGRYLCFLHREIHSLPALCYAGKQEDLAIRMELFIEIYGAFEGQWQELQRLPEAESVRRILYWFVSDYADVASLDLIGQMTNPGKALSVRILKEADISDLRYLYAYGEYIGENELEAAKFLNSLPEETIAVMADTYTEGYRIGFEVTGKDLSKKKTVEMMYPIGFERMMKKALSNFEKMGLQAVGRDQSTSILYGPGCSTSTSPNRQYGFDHKDDIALFLDKALAGRRNEVFRTAFEQYREEALGYAGPAVVETFGEKDFEPVNHPEAPHMTDAQNELWVDYRTQRRLIQSKYIIEEERSFTIIAFPVPEIRKDLPDPSMETYAEFFKEIIRINTLDYRLYRDIQETIINTLNKADYCLIKGMNGNRTDLKVNLYALQNPEKETIFENCVADVNIPVGEVFTSPVLEGTEGTLHVTRVFLNGLEYKDLALQFEKGCIADYSCSNFETEKENRDFIRENILFRHKTLPMGEFAIGTNTTAYVTARKYGVQAKLPILIAEKTGPHFAVGDTCYSHTEDMRVYNPDGKEIVAKDNEISLLRKTDSAKAYFNCHTDITIPYDELGELSAVTKEGEKIVIIREGRFVLAGTEELNRPLEEM